MVPGGSRSGQIFEIFEILGGAGDINDSISMPNYCNEPYLRLLPFANKVFSAWTEVWSGSYRAITSIMAPGGRDLDRFLSFWAGF